MSFSTAFLFARPWRLVLLWLLCLPFAPALARGSATGPPAPSLAQALNPDGTLRPGAQGSFDARLFTMSTAPDGKPVFRPAGTAGADDYRWQNGFGATGTSYPVLAVAQAANGDLYVGGRFMSVGDVAAHHIARWDGTSWTALGAGPSNGVNDAVNSYYSAVEALALAPNGDLYVGGSFTQAGGIATTGIARWNGSSWNSVGGGIAGSVTALAVASTGEVYAGGIFTQAGSVAASRIARWDGSSWSPLGAGLNNQVLALALAPSGELYAGGTFTQAGGVAASMVARWDGTSWQPLGTGVGTGYQVNALAVGPGGNVYAGGVFSEVGGSTAAGIARWNGSSWNGLGSGLGLGLDAGICNALALAPNGELYVGGQFESTGGGSSRNIVKWDGSSWSTIGPGLDNGPGGTGVVHALAVAATGAVYAGGEFSQSGSTVVGNLAAWNGLAWRPLGPTSGNGVVGVISALAVAANGDVYAGGEFVSVGALAVNNLARWDGAAWSALGTGPDNGVNGPVYALAVAGNGDLYVGGLFDRAGGAVINGLARWDGTNWRSVGGGLWGPSARRVRALAVAPSGGLYVGGSFTQVGGLVVNNLARWDGSSWSALGTGSSNGVSGEVTALLAAPGGELYVSGTFTSAGGISANNITKWNGSSWSALGSGLSGTPRTFFVRALALTPAGELYVGGNFTTAGGLAANNIARWDGSSWHTLGTGPSNGLTRSSGWTPLVMSLVLSSTGELYVGGGFSSGGGTALSHVAKWDGTSWSSPGTGLNNVVQSLALGQGGKLYAGGIFTAVGDDSKVIVGFGVYDPAAVSGTTPAAGQPVLRLYPNPAHATATLTLPAAPVARAVQVLDALGRLVRMVQLPAQAGSLQLRIAGLPAGTYTVRCGLNRTRLVVE